MLKQLSLLMLGMLFAAGAAAQVDYTAEREREASVLATSFLEGASLFSLASKMTGVTYDVRVALPPSYASREESYPLLIVLDGAMVFGTAAETAAVQVLTGETRPIIIAAVSTRGTLAEHNTRRLRDYTPAGFGNPSPELLDDNPVLTMLGRRFEAAGLNFENGLGGAAAFQSFLEQELLPRLQRDYRVDTEDLGLFGHSAGGVFVHSVLLSKTSPFSKFIIGTYSTMWYGDSLPEREAAFRGIEAPRTVDVFYGYGGEEVIDFGDEAIKESIDSLRRLHAAAPDYLGDLLIWSFEREQHGSVMASVIASGIHELWGTGVGYLEAAGARE